jgi:FdhD protein
LGVNVLPNTAGLQPSQYVQYTGATATTIDGGVIAEAQICLSVNGRELATVMCSPIDLPDLALGFLRAEGFIDSMRDVHSARVSADNSCVDVWLRKDIVVPERSIKTSGCGGGLTFDDYRQRHEPLHSTRALAPERITLLMRMLNGAAALYQEVRGVHTSALSDGESLLLTAQDIGRHNTIDRLWGMALRTGVETRDCILLASGRISSEMLVKAAKMGVPIVCSRTSPTGLSVQLAAAWNITVIGYARGGQFRVYSTPQRIGG